MIALLQRTGLSILASVYALVASLRNTLYDLGILPVYASRLPVVSVGNLLVGGTGKTPVVASLVSLLRQQGFRPVVLTRGYGGSVRSTHVVAADDSADYVGDEPLMLFRESGVPVVIAPRRADGARRIEQEDLGDLIILDDGFQHRALARDLDLVCLDGGDPRAIDQFISGALLPLGRLREPRDVALARADAVIITHRSIAPTTADQQKLRNLLPVDLPVLLARSGKPHLEWLATREPALVETAVAVCGIANPRGFLSSLTVAGVQLCEEYLFPDHHRFRQTDIDTIRKEHPELPLICTAKDAVKLEGLDTGACVVFRVSMVLENQEEWFACLRNGIALNEIDSKKAS